MDQYPHEVTSCFKQIVALVKVQDWLGLFERYEPAKSNLFLLAAGAAAAAHVLDTGEGEAELAEIHERDGGPMGEKGWPATVRNKPALFAELMKFSGRHENHHSPLPLIDWDEAELEDVVFTANDAATAQLVADGRQATVRFTRIGDRWYWAFDGDTVQIWGDHAPGECGSGHLRVTSPEGHVDLAEELLEEGDLAHAARHVASALGTNPTRREWRELLDRIAARSEKPEELLPVGGDSGTPFTEVAARAHVLAFAGKTQDAVDLIAQVVGYSPRRGYAAWAAEWLARHDGRLDTRGLFHGMAESFEDTVGFLRLRPSERAVFEAWAPIALALLERAKTERKTSEQLAIASGLLRRAGRLPEAERAARAAVEGKATTTSLSALGLVLRARGEWDAALEVFRRGNDLDRNAPFVAECARVLLDAGRLEEAAQTLPKEKTQDFELEVMRAWLARRLGKPRTKGWIGRLVGREATPDPQLDELASRLPERIDADTLRELWGHAVTTIPVPVDATANGVRSMHQRTAQQPELAKPGSVVELEIDGLEAPSGRLAFVLELGGDGTDFSRVKYSVKAIQKPDPRKPRRPVRDVIWIYGGKSELDVRQVLPPPGEAVSGLVAGLAASPYHLPTWWSAARKSGAKLGPSRVDEILGAMVHPPRRPERFDAAEWVFRNQVAGALVLAHVDDGWEGSRRREALFSLTDGVMDWTTDAAILALRELALDEPAAFDEIENHLWMLRDEVPRPGHPWYLDMLARSYLRLPGTPADRRQAFQAIYEADGQGTSA